MAALYGVESPNLVVTRGADDAIDILIRTFCRPGEDAISVCQPTFSAYAQFARLQGARVIETRLNADFDFDPGAFLAAAKDEPNLKLAFICAPNNPTGNPVAARRYSRGRRRACRRRSSSSTRPISNSPTCRASPPRPPHATTSSSCVPSPRPMAWPAPALVARSATPS